ncbi:MAG TPA: hypothetical protein PKD55_13530 [Bellilinea sp.]|nr:hypothetical protein [Bellilinea sp.]
MAQSIALAQKFQPILDEVYKTASLTARLDAKTKPVEFAGANVVQIFKTDPIGLGTYNRVSGYPAGQIVGAWETLTLAIERARAFVIDRMDNEESLGMAFGTLASEFIRTEVAPELDAYRFAKYAGTANINKVTAAAALSADTIITALDAAKLALDEDEVPREGRILYISDACLNMLEGKVSRFLANENGVDRRVMRFDGMDVVMVPQTRFYTGVTLNAGAAVDAGGYAKTGGQHDINFMIIHPSAVLQVTKHAALKVFTPEENQSTDGWLIQYRIYHDAFVLANKLNGIYLHEKNS